MSSNVNFPQGPLVGPGNFPTLEWQQWFQNPQFLSFSFAQPINVLSGGTGLSSGTSGGIPYFSAANSMASSAVLSANRIVLGGGSGAAPSTPVGLGTTTQVLHGNAAGAPTFGSVSLTADVSGLLPAANGGTGASTASANTFLAGPTSGGAVAPAFRTLVAADLPTTSLSNSISGDVALNNTASFFDGPSVAQGSSGTWLAIGTVTLNDTTGAANFQVKLYDGTTTSASAATRSTAASGAISVTVVGVFTSPSGNIRIAAKDSSSTSGNILFNSSGLSKDSSITVVRIG